MYVCIKTDKCKFLQEIELACIGIGWEKVDLAVTAWKKHHPAGASDHNLNEYVLWP